MEITVQTNYMADLVFHCLAHMKVDNDSELYSEEYISKINSRKLKTGFPVRIEADLEHLRQYYKTHFESVGCINFLPFYTGTIEELVNLSFHQPFFSTDDKDFFLTPFFEIVKREDVFYSSYWKESISAKKIDEAEFQSRLSKALKALGKFYEMIPFALEISLQQSMTRAGRACNFGEAELIAVKYPNNNEECDNSILQVIHELTHHFTDPLVADEIRMDDGTHMKAEYFVIWTDYRLIAKYVPEKKEIYLKYFNVADEEELDASYPVEEHMQGKLLSMFELE